MRLAALVLLVSAVFAESPVLVRAIRFVDFKKVSVTEILDRLNEREVRLEIEKPYHPEDAEEARRYIAELLAEKGRRDPRIEIVTRVVAPSGVVVEFRLMK
jgi:hypothetical protein